MQSLKIIMNVASRYAPSRVLSFTFVHVLKALQLMYQGYTSRSMLCKELSLGEGSIKTLIKHMKLNGLIMTSRAGTILTEKGKKICSELLSVMPAETELPYCSITLGRFNYAVLLKGFSFAIRSGIEQRDAAIKIGALGATTLIFNNDRFLMPGSDQDSLRNDTKVRRLLIDRLKPENNDVVIIGSADDKRVAELAAKNASLLTIINP